MGADVKTDGDDKRLNEFVAITVVILAVFMAITKIKDDNIVQAMQKAQSSAVDAWAEYQASRLKLHLQESGLATLQLLESTGTVDKTVAAKQRADYESEIKRYNDRSRETMAKAKGLEAEYDRLNFRDDQFDMSDAFLSIAIALAAVASLVDLYWLLVVSWVSGGIGMTFGVAGFAGWGLRPEWLAQFLGT